MSAQPPQKPIMSERRVGIIGACLAMIGPVSMAIYTPAMPEIVHAFGTSEEAVKMSLSLYFAGFAFAQLVVGPLSDGIGRRPATIAFMTIYTGASLVAVFAPNIDVLIAARFVQGIGAAAGIAMSRAIVRDLFNHDRAARVMNVVATFLAIGPALAPTIGGLTMAFFGWHAIFLVMVAAGIALVLLTLFAIRETVERDLSRIRPRALLASYGQLLGSPYFMTAGLANAGATSTIYALSTMLPFVMMNRVGLSPTQFGVTMLMQSSSFIAGSISLRLLMRRWSPGSLVPVGLMMMGLASATLGVGLRLVEPNFFLVMIPVASYAYGVAFVVSAMTTAAMAPFGRNAGAAAALVGFLQMFTGLVGGSLGALIGDATLALATITPALALMAIVSWLIWRRLPVPD